MRLRKYFSPKRGSLVSDPQHWYSTYRTIMSVAGAREWDVVVIAMIFQAVNSINEALASNFDAEALEGYMCNKTKQVFIQVILYMPFSFSSVLKFWLQKRELRTGPNKSAVYLVQLFIVEPTKRGRIYFQGWLHFIQIVFLYVWQLATPLSAQSYRINFTCSLNYHTFFQRLPGFFF